jgi:hypothetical protein
MSAQQIATPDRRRTILIVIALLLVALALGAVTAVNLFPAQASQRPVAGAGIAAWSGPLGRLDDRASVAGAGIAAWSGPLGRLADSASRRGGSVVRSAGAPRRQRPVAGAAWSGLLGR